jgi:hypothetical protein
MVRHRNFRRALRHVALVSTVMGVTVSTAVAAEPMQRAFATSAGNLLVSTGVYTDQPAITAASTPLPVNNTFTITTVAQSGSTVTITTSAKSGFIVGQTVTLSGVTGADGNQTILTLPSTTSFTFTDATTVTTCSSCTGAAVDGNIAIGGPQYPYVFNNDNVEANFGVSEPIVLDEIPAQTSLVTTPVSQTTVPNSDTVASGGDQMVTSFSSKSELALNQSTDGKYVTFMGYNSPTAAVDISNANTPGAVDSTNTDTANPVYRVVAQYDGLGNFQFTETNAYSGNNGRAAVEVPGTGSNPYTIFTAGNAGNGSKPEPQGVVEGTGSQIMAAAAGSEATQSPAALGTTYGAFSITQLPAYATPDTEAKDTNFRGLTLSNGVIYMTKGSGSNGVDTVFFVDTTGNACPSTSSTPGVGLPGGGAALPEFSTWTNPPYPVPVYNAIGPGTAAKRNPDMRPDNMCILNGFPTGLATNLTTGAYPTAFYPFGLWFANSTTLYVADEGNGSLGTISGTGSGPYTFADAQTANNSGGLDKFSLVDGTWQYDYTLNNGLNLGTSYSVNNSGGHAYPTGANNTQGGAGNPWNPATDGLRNIIGRTNGDGTVSIWGTTSTVSGGGDQGADPNQVVAITDNLAATTLPASETFSTVLAPTYGVVYRGVAFTPGTAIPPLLPEAPWAALIPISALAIGGGAFWIRRRRRVAGGVVVAG